MTLADSASDTYAMAYNGGATGSNIFNVKAGIGNSSFDSNPNYDIEATTYNDLTAFNADVANVVSTLNSATTSVEWYVDNGTIAMKPIA